MPATEEPLVEMPPDALGVCEVCGEGHTFPRASVAVIDGGIRIPLLARRCDACKSEFAGYVECAANTAMVKAVRAAAIRAQP